MAKLTETSAKLTDEITLTKKSSKINFTTGAKYVNKDIEVGISIPGIRLNNGESFYIQAGDDESTRWTWRLDENGNLYVEDANYE